MSQNPTLCLIDGSGYIFRAFYALPPITRPDGVPVGAVYGFTKMLMGLIKENPCTHMLVLFDAKRKNFRNEIYPDYKANRKETPPELIPQFPLIRQATKAFSIPYMELEGYEADDLIATYARLATEQGFKTRVISADKDLMQLMNEDVRVYDPMKKKLLSETDVLEKFGVPPDKVVDVQALMGDSSDNIPGAGGIGPKTAAALINEFGSLENLLTNLDKIPQEKRRIGLKNDAERVRISKQLATLDTHVPVSDYLDQFQLKTPDADKINAFLLENNFKSLQPLIPDFVVKQNHNLEQPHAQPKPVQSEYVLIQDEKTLAKWIEQCQQQPVVFLDTETTALDWNQARLVGFSLSDKPGHACYVPLRHGGEENTAPDLFATTPHRAQQIPVQKALDLLAPLLKNPMVLKVGHNIKYDLHILAKEYGAAFECAPVTDTLLMSYDLDGTNHGHSLDELAALFLSHTTIKYDDVCGTGKSKITFDQVDVQNACAYAAEDADITGRLYFFLKERLEQSPVFNIYQTIDNPLIPILFEMEEKGILVDARQLQTLQTDFAKQLSALTQEIYTLAGEEFNINSPAQLGVILFEKMNVGGGKKGVRGKWTTDSDVLEKLAFEGNQLAQKVLDYRAVSKLKNTYVDALLDLQAHGQKRIHTSFSLTATNTGRLASSNPNLQNIPVRSEAGKKIRQAFIAKPGHRLICADYSQIELRLLADVAQVKALQTAFLENADIHASTAAQVFGIPLQNIDADTRRRAKAINFGIVYGISAFGLANQLGISRNEAGQYINTYFEKYPEIKEYMAKTIAFAKQHEYVLTPLGRRCFIKGFDSSRTRGFAERAAINAPIQGGAADLIKLAMIHVVRRLKEEKIPADLLLQIHDELIFEVPENAVEAARAVIQSTMEQVAKLSIPLIVDVGVGHSWKEAH